MFIRFDTKNERDRQTDGQIPHDGIGRAVHRVACKTNDVANCNVSGKCAELWWLLRLQSALCRSCSKFNKNIAITSRSRVSCAHNSSRASPWPWNLRWGSLKVNGNGTIGQITQDFLWDELLDVEYYRDLEMWVKGHWMSLKVVSFESLGTVSYSPSIVTMAVSVAVCEIFSVKECRDLENQIRVVYDHWKWRRSIDHMRLSIGRPLYI